jgi:hypothetical protein
MWWFIDKYNLFQLPTAEEAQRMVGHYSAPPLYWFLERMTLVVCPGLWLGFFTMDMGRAANEVMWMIATVVNVLLFFLVGYALRESLRVKSDAAPVET